VNPKITEGILPQLLAAGMPPEQASVKLKLFESAINRLQINGVSPAAQLHGFYVPGRIEFLGKHTDYAGGRSMVCAVDRGFCIVAAARSDALVRVVGETSATDLIFEIKPDLIPTPGHWSNYPMTVGRRVAQNFPGALGADIAFSSDLPVASGLSSSSALITAFFLAICAVNRLDERAEYQSHIHDRLELAAYVGTIENGQSFGCLTGDRGVGTFGGSEDHTAILTGVAGKLSQYSFCPARFERHLPLPADHSLVVGVSGVIAEKTGAALHSYNDASLLARGVLEQWRKSSGQADATLAAAVAGHGDAVRRSLTDPKLIDRLDHFVAESTQIIPAAGDALLAGRLDQLGQLVDRSQSLAETLLKNQVPETVYLCQSAREFGAIAASSFGAGFGGSVWALVRSVDIAKFIQTWQAAYRSRFPVSAAQAAFFQANSGVAATQVHL
jgi:galactokinase